MYQFPKSRGAWGKVPTYRASPNRAALQVDLPYLAESWRRREIGNVLVPRHCAKSFGLKCIAIESRKSVASSALISSFSMAVETSPTPLDPFLRGNTSKNTRGLLRIIILFTIAAAAVSARLFSVIRTFRFYPRHMTMLIFIGFESIIHEC
jgi:hypothetical protein